MSVLVSLLAWLGVLAAGLTGARTAAVSTIVPRILAMGLVGTSFAAMVWVLLCRPHRARAWCYLQFLTVVVAASLPSGFGSNLRLGAVLVVLAAFLLNAVAMVYLTIPAVQAYYQGADAGAAAGPDQRDVA